MQRWLQFQLKNTLIWLFSLFIYLILRLEYLYWNWAHFGRASGEDLWSAIWMGFRFDLSSTAYLMMPLFLLSFVTLWKPISWKMHWFFSLVLSIPWMILNFIDIEFVNFVGRRWTSSSLYIWHEAQGKMGGFISSYGIWLLIGFLQFILWSWGLKKALSYADQWTPDFLMLTPKKKLIILSGLVGKIFLVLLVISARGGVQKKPISMIHANTFNSPALNNLSLNSTFTILKSFGRPPLPKPNYFSNPQDAIRLQNGNLVSSSLLQGLRPSAPQNVVILIMESFALEYMGKVNGVKGYTPFLDQLAEKPGALFFKHGFANARRSIEGVAAILAGIPALMSEPFISSEFATNSILGMGTFLHQKKYTTAFFHGGANGTMYFDHFTKTIGIEKYYGLNEYPDSKKDFDGTWGIYDRPFFRFFTQQLNQFPTPFAVSLFSLSSHQPYKIPDEEKSNYPDGPIEILASISYADDSLREFFSLASQQPWYKNTLFVITGDHTQKNYLPQYENEISKYKVPLILFHPTMKWPVVDQDQVVQQIDVLPTVLDFLNFPAVHSIKLGSSVFQPGDKTALIYNEGRYLLVAKDFFLDWPLGQEPLMYSRQDETQAQALSQPADRKAELEQRMKAGIQYFSDSLWNNSF